MSIRSSRILRSGLRAILAKELREAGFSVTERVGVYRDGSKACGVVGMMKNGAGPTLLVRGDMDALPIVEETGVAYASHVKAKNLAGQEVGVMHACGHDVHTTVLMGTARALAAAKSQVAWDADDRGAAERGDDRRRRRRCWRIIFTNGSGGRT